jgi:sialic acid synthase SpsE
LNSDIRLIAEIGANHGGDVDTAHTMIDALAGQGCKYVKFQIYTAEELIADPNRPTSWGPTKSRTSGTVGGLFRSVSLPWESFPELFDHAREKGMEPFGTPFSLAGLELLLGLDAKFVKIASSDVEYTPLLEACGESGKPVILSLGKATLANADDAVSVLESSGCQDLTLLHCIAAYPTPVAEANLRNIQLLKLAFPQYEIGFSDHTEDYTASIVAVALGATMIERHVTSDVNGDGPDDWFSLHISKFGEFATTLDEAKSALGTTRKRIQASEKQGRLMGTRSLFAATDIPPDTQIEQSHIVALRPRTGLEIRTAEGILGLSVTRFVKRGEPINWEMFRH